MKKIIVIILILTSFINNLFSEHLITITVGKIKDNSNYNGDCDIESNVLQEAKKIFNTISITNYDHLPLVLSNRFVKQEFKLDITIQRYNLELKEISSPGIAGYQVIESHVGFKNKLYKNNSYKTSFTEETVLKKRKAGLTILNGPKGTNQITDYISEIYNSDFYNEKYRQSVLFKSVLDTLIKTSTRLALYTLGLESHIVGYIHKIRGNSVYIETDNKQKNTDFKDQILYVFSYPEHLISYRDNQSSGNTDIIYLGNLKTGNTFFNNMLKGKLIESYDDIKQGDIVIKL